jgi:fructokinase
VLGGAPFNVAWHLQALGDQPQLISRVGNDDQGQHIVSAMADWQMDTANIQLDKQHQTGRVNISIVDNEPHYDIVADCAYDFIQADLTKLAASEGILYHGSLALRNTVSHQAFMALTKQLGMPIFLDVNLRPPWWQKSQLADHLQQARWVKLNEHELQLLGFSTSPIKQGVKDLQSAFQLEHVILTRGAQGAMVLTSAGEWHDIVPEPAEYFVDTVGAGDAFTAVYMHGLLSGWSVPDTLKVAQRFASKVVGLRGATSTDPTFYQDFLD